MKMGADISGACGLGASTQLEGHIPAGECDASRNRKVSILRDFPAWAEELCGSALTWNSHFKRINRVSLG